MTSPWTDGEELTAALMYARTTALITAVQALTNVSADVTTGVFTAANGSTITGQRGRIEGNYAVVYCAYTIGSAGVTGIGTPGSGGDVSNTAVLNIAAAYQTAMGFPAWGLQSAQTGRTATHIIVGTTVALASLGNSAAVTAGDAFSFTGRYPLS